MSAVSSSNLHQSYKDFAVAWEETRSHWRDVKSHEFEDKFLKELPGQIAQVKNVMDELDHLLRKVRYDCE